MNFLRRTSSAMEVLYERRPSAEITQMEEMHREEIKVWKGLYDDVCAQLQGIKSQVNLQSELEKDWLLAEIGILNGTGDRPVANITNSVGTDTNLEKIHDDDLDLNELLSLASRLTRENTQLYLQNAWFQASLLIDTTERTDSVTDSWTTAIEYSAETPIVGEFDIPRVIVNEQIVIENAWLQASLLIKEAETSDSVFIERYQNDLELAWLQGTVGVPNAALHSRDTASYQKDLELAWLQGTVGVTNAALHSKEVVSYQKDLELAWLQGTVGVANAALNNQETASSQKDLELAWLQGSNGITNTALHSRDTVSYQKDLELAWLQGSVGVTNAALNNQETASYQKDLEMAWLQGTVGVLSSGTSITPISNVNQKDLEMAWLQGSVGITNAAIKNQETASYQKDLTIAWLQGQLGIANSYTKRNDQDYIEKAWFQASLYINQQKDSFELPNFDLESLKMTRRGSRRSSDSTSTEMRRKNSVDEKQIRRVRSNRSLPNDPVTTGSLDRPRRISKSLENMNDLKSILKTESNSKPKHVHIVIDSEKLPKEVSPRLDTVPSKQVKPVIVKSGLSTPEEYQQVLKNAWLQGTLGILNAQKKEEKPFLSARQRLLQRRNSKEKSSSGSVSGVGATLMTGIAASGPVATASRSLPTSVKAQPKPLAKPQTKTTFTSITQQDVQSAWFQAESMIKAQIKTQDAQWYIQSAWFQAESMILKQNLVQTQDQMEEIQTKAIKERISMQDLLMEAWNRERL